MADILDKFDLLPPDADILDKYGIAPPAAATRSVSATTAPTTMLSPPRPPQRQPPGARITDEDAAIMRAYGFREGDIAGSARYRPGEFAEQVAEPVAPAWRMPIGAAVRSFLDPVHALAQLGRKGMAGVGLMRHEDVAVEELRRRIGARKYREARGLPEERGFLDDPLRDLAPALAPIGRIAGGLATVAGKVAPRFAPIAGKAAKYVMGPANSLRRTAAAGAGWATLGSPTEGAPEDYWKELETRAELGAVLGPLFKAGIEKGVAPATAKTASFVTGRLEPAAMALAALAEKHKMPMLATDLSRRYSWLHKIAAALEGLPFGPGGLRQAQATRATDLAQRLQADLLEKLPLETVRNELGQEQVARSWPDTLLRSIARVKQARQAEKTRLYKEAAGATDPLQELLTGPQDPLVLAFDDAIARLKWRPAEDRPAITKLQGLRKKLVDPAIEHNASYLDALRSDLGDMVSGKKTGVNALIGPKGIAELLDLKTATGQRLDDAVAVHGTRAMQGLWAKAREYYTREMAPYKRPTVTALTGSDDPEKAATAFLRGTSRPAVLLSSLLDTEGRDALRAGFLQDVVGKSASEKGWFMPNKFATTIDELADPYEVVFRKGAPGSADSRARVDEMVDLFRNLTRAGASWDTPASNIRAVLTGAAGLGALAVGGGYINPYYAVLPAAMFGIPYLTTKALTGPLGKRAITATSRWGEIVPALDRHPGVSDEMRRAAVRALVTEASRDDPWYTEGEGQ